MKYSIEGKKVRKTSFTEQNLSFTLEDGSKIEYEAIGDCCSKSFIESIDDIEVLQNCTILEFVEERGESKQVETEDYNHDVYKWTFYKIKTDKGYATLSFRNESNGYYDGELVLAGTGQYSGEY